MSDLKFENFIYDRDKDGDLHDLSEIEDDEIYIQKFENHMLCPSCKVARLVRSHSATGTMFLKTAPRSAHGYVDGEPCYFSQEPAPQYAIREHLQDLARTKNLQPKLESLIRRLKSEDLRVQNSDAGESLTKILSLKYAPKNTKKEKQAAIPKYSINKWEDIPEDELVAVYGKVTIKVKKTSNKNDPTKYNTYLRLFKLGTNNRLTSVFVMNHLAETVDGNYYFAAFGTKEKHDDYFDLEPFILPDGIVLEKI